MRIKWAILLVFVMFGVLRPETAVSSGPAALTEEDMRVRYVDLKTNREHARARCLIRRRDGAVVVQFLKEYDRDTRKIVFEKTGPQGELLQRAVYPLEGPTCDDVTLMVFLKSVVGDFGDKDRQVFYLLTDEPRRYRVIVRFLGEEPLSLPGGTVLTAKYQLIGDLGPLSDLAAKLIPPTFVWYSPAPPFDWWQYEGMECGPKSAYIRAFVEERDAYHDSE